MVQSGVALGHDPLVRLVPHRDETAAAARCRRRQLNQNVRIWPRLVQHRVGSKYAAMVPWCGVPRVTSVCTRASPPSRWTW